MTYEIWQAPAEQVFRSISSEYDRTHTYVSVWAGEVSDILRPGDDEYPPDVWKIARARIFNAFQRVDDDHMPPVGYRGRSLSAGDVVRIGGDWWFCQPLSWKLIEPPLSAQVTV